MAWQNRIFDVQMMYWNDDAIISREDHERLTMLLKNHLGLTRSLIHRKLGLIGTLPADKIDQVWTNEFSTSIPQISVDCTERMIQLAKLVMESSVSCLASPPPCAFSAIAIGSMAKGEATPYSDMEFMFLLERKDEAVIRYFEILAMTVYFLIGNLGETKLSYMAIEELEGWFGDTCMNGFKIDGLAKGAGNIPTGNGSTNQQNHFILTVDELILRYKQTLDNPDEKEAKRGDFTAMMAYTRQFYSHGRTGDCLLQRFKKQQKAMVFNTERIEVNRAMFDADVAKYGFKPDQKIAQNGYVVDSKKDLYRYPSIILFNISILTRTSDQDTWITLNLLRQSGIISQTIHKSLHFLLCCACYFRLSAYLHHNSHDDRISILLEDESSNPVYSPTSSTSRWFVPQGLFNMYCEFLVPIKRHFAQGQSCALVDLLNRDLREGTWHTKFITLHCCHRWFDVWEFLTQTFGKDVILLQPELILGKLNDLGLEIEEICQSIKGLTYTLYQKREYSAALTYHTMLLKEVESNSQDQIQTKQLLLADIMDETANALVYIHKHDAACTHYLSSFEIRKKILDETSILLGESHLQLGRCYRIQKKCQLAERHLLQALTIFHTDASREIMYDYRGDKVSTQQPAEVNFSSLNPLERLSTLNHTSASIVHTMLNLTDLLCTTKYYSLAKCYSLKALDFILKLYGKDANHRLIADTMFTCAYSCSNEGDHRQADAFYCRSFEMISKIFTGINRSPYKNLPGMNDTDRWGVSDARAKLIINTFLALPGYKVPHPQSASVLKRYGKHMMNVEKYQMAETCLEKAISMYKESVEDAAASFDMASTSAALGLALIIMRNDYKRGLVMCTSALEKLAKLGDQTSMFEAAEIHQKLHQVMSELGTTEEARYHHKTALLIYKEQTDDPCHPKILELQ